MHRSTSEFTYYTPFQRYLPEASGLRGLAQNRRTVIKSPHPGKHVHVIENSSPCLGAALEQTCDRPVFLFGQVWESFCQCMVLHLLQMLNVSACFAHIRVGSISPPGLP